MSEAQGTKTPSRPWHLWLIGVVGGLWSLIGVMSFMLTQMNVEAVMSQYPPEQREYFETFPLWADAFWAIYKEYETDRVKLGDRTLELIKEFPDAAAVTGPTTIRTLAAEWLKLRDDKNKLIKKYYAMAEKQLSPRIASRWMQIEHRIGLLIDLQIASEVPLIDRLPR